MSDGMFENDKVIRLGWGAIWAGAFTFIAIWAVFGLLGRAIFVTAEPNPSVPATGIGVGISIWGVVLTIIAMYIAGRATSHLGGIRNSLDGVMHGIVMFGLSLTSVLMLTILSAGGGGMAAGARIVYLPGMFANLGWVGFVALFLGWLAAMGGAAHVASRGSASSTSVQETRRAA